MVAEPQWKIAGWLGFDADRSTARILAKVIPQAACVERLFYLRTALQDADAKKRLWHIPTLSWPALRLLCDGRAAQHLCSTFYDDPILQDGTTAQVGDLLELIRDTVASDAVHGMGVPPRQIRTMEELLFRSLSTAALTNSLFAVELTSDVPDPTCSAPFGAVRQVRSVQALIDEGREMRHCIGSLPYLLSLVSGRIRVYKVTSPIRATAMLAWKNERWRLTALHGFENSQLDAGVHTMVSSWFSET
jgi:hypothetical protein